MASFIPVPGTTTGRLVAAALALFGERGYAEVGVGEIAERAGVTTGSIYHHFGSKAGLYGLVRDDVERRVVDRLEGAAAARPVRSVADLAAVLLPGFDYLVRSGYARMLGEPAPESAADADDGAPVDPIEALITALAPDGGAALGALVAAAWRAALGHAGRGADEARDARAALTRLLVG